MIQGFAEVTRGSGFYDNVGNLNSEFAKLIERNRKQKIIGWYRYRPNTPLRPSLREMSVHKNIVSYITKTEQKSYPLLFAIFNFSRLDYGATHNIDFKFLQITWNISNNLNQSTSSSQSQLG